jgi:hypothetical protein
MTLILNGTDNSATTPAVTGSDTDTGVYYPAANQVAIATGGTQALIADASQNIGISKSAPVARLHLAGSGTSGQVTSSFIIENTSSGTMGVDITGAAGSSVTRFRYGGGPGTGTNAMTGSFMTAGLEGVSAGMQGIQFAATQVASANANTLDDYEEGTWTPVVKFGSTTATLTSSSASYTKIGRVVTLMIEAYVTNLNGGTGGFSLTNFPFNAYSYNRQTVAQFYFQFMSASFPAGDKFAFIQPNDSTLAVNYFTGSSGTAGSLDNTHFTTSSYVYASIIYFAP